MFYCCFIHFDWLFNFSTILNQIRSLHVNTFRCILVLLVHQIVSIFAIAQLFFHMNLPLHIETLVYTDCFLIVYLKLLIILLPKLSLLFNFQISVLVITLRQIILCKVNVLIRKDCFSCNNFLSNLLLLLFSAKLRFTHWSSSSSSTINTWRRWF